VPLPEPVPASVPARRPRSSPAATRPRPTSPPRACSRRSHRPRPLRACGAPAGYLLPNDAPPHLFCDRAGAGPMTTFSSLCSIGTITRSVPPHSSRRNAVIGPTAARSLRLRFAPPPRGLVQSCYPRGRRGGFAAHGAVTPGLCCGPRYAASGARKRAPADHVSRPSRRGPPQQRRADSRLREEDASWGWVELIPNT